MGEFKKLDGNIGESFQLDVVNDGPMIKHDGLGAAQVRNAADSDYETLSVGQPTNPQHAATRLYVDSVSKPLIVVGQFDGNDALPANTAVIRYLVVTTTGANATIGEIIYDDGTNTGTTQVLSAENGRTISTTTTLTGGTISFDADAVYHWDADGSSGTSNVWVKISDVGNVTGALRVISYLITNAATQDSTAQIPAGAYVLEARLTVTTPYSGGATIEIGTTADADAFQTTTDNKADKGSPPNRFVKDQETLVASASVVRTTIAGAPAAGAGRVTVLYAETQA
jgi:hypothetical protein